MRRPVRGWLLLLVVALSLTGCVSLPESGPVRSEPVGEEVEDEPPVDFTPGGPEAGAEPVEIARGFLEAMQATPLNTSVARRFLTAESGETWVPEEGAIVYGEETRAVEGEDVLLSLQDTVRLDSRGAWLGSKGTGDMRFRLDLVREKGQWRINRPPDRLIIPLAHFQTRFQQFFLYFFDKTGQVLVPEPVYVPTGAQATTFLVSGLLAGPGPELLGVERTYIPARTALDDISVPVTQTGVAEVPLSDEILDLDRDQLPLAFGQLATTLAQVPGVERMRVTVDGSPLELPAVGADVSVDDWSELDPALAWASESLFGIRDGRVTTQLGGEERRVSGVFGSFDLDLRSIAVDLPGERIAGVTDDGRVLLGARSRPTGTSPKSSDAETVVVGGQNLLKPAWDLYGHLWVADRTSTGARVVVIHKGETRQVEIEGISGNALRSFVLSRDGTRLVAEVDNGRRERLLVSRVLRDATGEVRRLTKAERIPLDDLDVKEIRDIAWRTPGSLALLTAPTSNTSQVLIVKVDGSSTVAEASTGAEVFSDQADRLVTSPVLGSPLYIRSTDGLLFALASNGRWTGAGIERGLRSPTFVG